MIPTIGQSLIYRTNAAERASWATSLTECPALCLISHGDGDATMVVFYSSPDAGGEEVARQRVHRANEDAPPGVSEGTWSQAY